MTFTTVIIVSSLLLVFMVCFLVYEIKQIKKNSEERKKFLKLLGSTGGDLIEIHLKVLNVTTSFIKNCGGQFSVPMIKDCLNRESKTTLYLRSHEIFLTEIINYFIQKGWVKRTSVVDNFYVLTEKGEKVANYSSALLSDAKPGFKARVSANWSRHSD